MPPTVRIFCVDHRPDGLRNPLDLASIGVGANRQPGILHDCDGANIAELNPHLNEATALWWLWQHPEARQGADYIGLCHYRRFLLFSPVQEREGFFRSRLRGCHLKPSLINHLHRLPVRVRDAARCLEASSADGILPLREPFPDVGGFAQTLVDAHRASAEWIQRMIDITLSRAPDFGAYLEKSFHSPSKIYCYETFVVRTELFIEMCATLFPIAQQFVQEWQSAPDSSHTHAREPGYLFEILLGAYWGWLREKHHTHFLHVRFVTFVGNGHGWWYVGLSRLGYRWFPDGAAKVFVVFHRTLVNLGLMAKPE